MTYFVSGWGQRLLDAVTIVDCSRYFVRWDELIVEDTPQKGFNLVAALPDSLCFSTFGFHGYLWPLNLCIRPDRSNKLGRVFVQQV